MTTILDNELVRKYFGCKDSKTHLCFSSDDCHMSYDILRAMQEPIGKGERYLFLAEDQWLENDSGCYRGFHPKELRLPDRFQPQEKKECENLGMLTCFRCHRELIHKPKPSEENKECSCSDKSVWEKHICSKCGVEMAVKRDAVEEKIKEVMVYFQMPSSGVLEAKLRELVRLARE